MTTVENRKYELIPVGRRPVHRMDKILKFYQLKALRDIPEHGVKAGDLGGFVTSPKTLSPIGSCWIGGNAMVVGKRIRVQDSTYIGDEAVVMNLPSKTLLDKATIIVSGFARIDEQATVMEQVSFGFLLNESKITDKTHIYGNALVHSTVLVSGGSKIYGSACIKEAVHIDNCEIKDEVSIGNRSTVNNSSIYGATQILKRVIVESSDISGNTVIEDKRVIIGGTIIKDNEVIQESYVSPSSRSYGKIFSAQPGATTAEINAGSPIDPIPAIEPLSVAEPSHITAVSPAYLRSYKETCEGIDSYRTDIAKIIKYPVMTDQTNDCTLDMMLTLKTAQRLEDSPESEDFKTAVANLEKAFMKAESNARRISSSLLSADERKKTEKARDLFWVAANEASSEQEKKVAFKQGFKQLEGVLDVPDIAVDAFRVKIGLQELEKL